MCTEHCKFNCFAYSIRLFLIVLQFGTLVSLHCCMYDGVGFVLFVTQFSCMAYMYYIAFIIYIVPSVLSLIEESGL